MLARDRFETETPNAIDPGEFPPPRPSRPRSSAPYGDSGNDDEEPQAASENHTEENSGRIDRRRRLMLSASSSRYGSLYTRNGNKGALSRGIPIRFILDPDDDDDDDDYSNSTDNSDACDESQEEIVFGKSTASRMGEMPFCDEEEAFENQSSLETATKNPYLMNDDYNNNDDDHDEENGIAQARLYAAAILNESGKRQTSQRDLMADPSAKANLRHMMIRASSFRIGDESRTAQLAKARASSFRMTRASSLRQIPIDESADSTVNNIWLVVDDASPSVSSAKPAASKRNLLRQKMVRVGMALVIGIIVTTIFAVAAGNPSLSAAPKDTTLSAEGAISSDPHLRDIVEFLGETMGISSIENLYESSTPQFKAARWLATEDSERLNVPTSVEEYIGVVTTKPNANAVITPFDLVQRYVLLVLYFASGGGDATAGGNGGWTDEYHFASPDRHECSWYKRLFQSDQTSSTNVVVERDDDADSAITNIGGEGFDIGAKTETEHKEIEDAARYLAMGVACDRELRVRSIVLRECDCGSIVSALWNRVLFVCAHPLTIPLSFPSNRCCTLIAANNIEGSIPSEVQYLSALDFLDLGDNHLVGSIPKVLQNLVQLTHLDLSGNQLTGQISPLYWLGNNKLTHLEFLDLSNNLLDLDNGRNHTHGRRKSIGGETRLKTLALGGNANGSDDDIDTVSIPEEIRYLTSLEELSLESSNIGGRIPAWLFHELHELQFLDLSDNRLTGSISGVFPSGNRGLSSPMQNLKFLLLHDNHRLTGTLPESIGLLPDLGECIVIISQKPCGLGMHCNEEVSRILLFESFLPPTNSPHAL